MECAQGVGGVAVAVLGGTQPPHGGALLVTHVPQQEAEGTGGAGLAVLGRREVPAARLLQLTTLLQDGAEVQGRAAVTARGSLPVPLLGLADPPRGGARDGAVAPSRRTVVQDVRGARSEAAPRAEGVVRVAQGLALQGAGEAVGGLPVALLGGSAQPALGTDVTAVLQQVGQCVGTERVALLGGLAQPVLGTRLVTALPEVTAERVGGRGGAGDRGDAPPSGRLVRVPPLVEENAQVVGRGPVALGGRRPQVGLGAVQVTTTQKDRAQDAHGLGVATVRGPPVALLGLLGVIRGVRSVRRVRDEDGVVVGGVVSGAGGLGDGRGKYRICHVFRRPNASLHKPPCLQQSCPVPHKYHRRTTCNPRTPGIPRPVRSLQRFVDMPTERQVKHVRAQLMPREPHFTPTT